MLVSGNSDPFKTDPVSYDTTSRTATELEEELATETSCTPPCDIFADPAAWPQVVITPVMCRKARCSFSCQSSYRTVIQGFFFFAAFAASSLIETLEP